MADFMGQHPGQLGLVVGQGQKPAGDVEIAGGQGKSIGRGAVQYGDAIGDVGACRGASQEAGQTSDVLLQFTVLIGPTECLQDFGMGLFGKLTLPDSRLTVSR